MCLFSRPLALGRALSGTAAPGAPLAPQVQFSISFCLSETCLPATVNADTACGCFLHLWGFCRTFYMISLSSLHCFLMGGEDSLIFTLTMRKMSPRILSNFPEVTYLLSEEFGLRLLSSDCRPVLVPFSFPDG